MYNWNQLNLNTPGVWLGQIYSSETQAVAAVGEEEPYQIKTPAPTVWSD